MNGGVNVKVGVNVGGGMVKVNVGSGASGLNLKGEKSFQYAGNVLGSPHSHLG